MTSSGLLNEIMYTSRLTIQTLHQIDLVVSHVAEASVIPHETSRLQNNQKSGIFYGFDTCGRTLSRVLKLMNYPSNPVFQRTARSFSI